MGGNLMLLIYIINLVMKFRPGDLLCCETCSAVYHLDCVDPKMSEIPDEDWFCSVCTEHQVTMAFSSLLPVILTI